jgi:phosphate transport system substrate-binding protein
LQFSLCIKEHINSIMKKYILITSIVLIFIIVYACDKIKKKEIEETIITGKATVLVDETLMPIIEEQVAVFESQYDAKITLIAKSESEIVQSLSKNKNQIAILSRELSKNEREVFEIKKIKGKITSLATDGIALISNRNNNDTLVSVQDVISFAQGKPSKIKGLVFDNANSSTVRYIKELAKVNNLPKENIFSFNNNNEVIDYISKNNGIVGVVGVNWLSEPMPEMESTIAKIRVLSVKDKNNKTYVKPSQDNIASGLYPMTREIKLLNYQGYQGLGMGFASFIGGEIGQRIILKSGLVPVRIPGRNIKIRKEIEKK